MNAYQVLKSETDSKYSDHRITFKKSKYRKIDIKYNRNNYQTHIKTWTESRETVETDTHRDSDI